MKLTYFLPLIIVLLFYKNIKAQWTNTGGPPSRAIQCFSVNDSMIIAGTDGGLVRSTNNGANWANIGSGISYSNIRSLLSIKSYPFNLLAGTNNGATFKSSNLGDNFTGFPIDSVQIGGIANVNSILHNDPRFWAATDKGIYLLTEYYPLQNWIPYNDGLPSAEIKVRVVMEKDGGIFIGTESGVYKLNGSTWIPKNTGLLNTNVEALVSSGGYLFAGTSQGSVGGVYISSDNGGNWSLSKSDSWVTSIVAIGSNIFVGSFGDGVWLSKNYGTTWNQINDGFGGAAYYVLSLNANDQYIFAGTNNANVWRRPLSQVTGITKDTNLQPEQFSFKSKLPKPI